MRFRLVDCNSDSSEEEDQLFSNDRPEGLKDTEAKSHCKWHRWNASNVGVDVLTQLSSARNVEELNRAFEYAINAVKASDMQTKIVSDQVVYRQVRKASTNIIFKGFDSNKVYTHSKKDLEQRY